MTDYERIRIEHEGPLTWIVLNHPDTANALSEAMLATLVGAKRAKEFSFVAGNTIDGKTAVEWGIANHAVPADRPLDAVREIAARIAMVPSDALRIKKLSLNRAAEPQGFRQAVQHGAEMDSLLHLAPSVVALKARIANVGLKQVMAEYRSPSTMSLLEKKAEK